MNHQARRPEVSTGQITRLVLAAMMVSAMAGAYFLAGYAGEASTNEAASVSVVSADDATADLYLLWDDGLLWPSQVEVISEALYYDQLYERSPWGSYYYETGIYIDSFSPRYEAINDAQEYARERYGNNGNKYSAWDLVALA